MATFTSFIADRQNIVADQKKQMAILRANKADVQKGLALMQAAVKAATRADADAQVETYAYPYVSNYNEAVELTLQITEHNAKMLNSKTAKRIMGTLMLAGVDFEQTEKVATEYAAGSNAIGKLTFGKVTCEFKVRTRLASEGATCEKVQVGVETKVVETPVYEIRCN